MRTNFGRNLAKQIEAVVASMTTDEEELLHRCEAATDRRGTWTRALVFGGVMFAVAALLWAARMLNGAWSNSARLASEQRLLSTRLRPRSTVSAAVSACSMPTAG